MLRVRTTTESIFRARSIPVLHVMATPNLNCRCCRLGFLHICKPHATRLTGISIKITRAGRRWRTRQTACCDHLPTIMLGHLRIRRMGVDRCHFVLARSICRICEGCRATSSHLTPTCDMCRSIIPSRRISCRVNTSTSTVRRESEAICRSRVPRS
jgi:hypothetical protein